ncbi:hypothetical protein [Phaeobacter inhibens]|uniref:hypothetical protein n=1 Tax=Phaeobacter inhibens TaxID=221822 RepID=UPI000C9C4054|nr:hypothetical protein [Phaeobacter inhibens]AUR22531.1 hypothetical protein PhaeoP80_04508 [Phaeobacter inhibens]
MSKVFENPAYLRAKLYDMQHSANTAKLHDKWAYVGADGNTYTHPTEQGAMRFAGTHGLSVFTLRADYDTDVCEFSSSDEIKLRMFGKDHHAAAKIKPDMTLLDPAGNTIATMDAWATDWTEAGQ